MGSLFILVKFIVLGIVQGLTEPLPISSSGHLVLLRHFFNVEAPGLTFEIIVHFGSLLAVILVYRRDILQLAKESFHYMFRGKTDYVISFRFTMYLFTATVITGGFGLLLKNMISSTLSNIFYVGIAFLVTSFFIWLIQRMHGHKTAATMSFKDAIIIGLSQVLALVPGISRSGTTIVAGMLLGLDRRTTLKFSFLLFIPVGFGVNLMSAGDIYHAVTDETLFIPYVVAFLAAIIATYYALKYFIRVMMQGRLFLFSLYCFIIGVVTLLTQLSF